MRTLISIFLLLLAGFLLGLIPIINLDRTKDLPVIPVGLAGALIISVGIGAGVFFGLQVFRR